MLFINPIHLIISVAFSSSVTPCFFAISFIRYSAISRAEVSISARCSYNFPLVSRLKYSTLFDKFLQITTNFFTRNEKNDTASLIRLFIQIHKIIRTGNLITNMVSTIRYSANASSDPPETSSRNIDYHESETTQSPYLFCDLNIFIVPLIIKSIFALNRKYNIGYHNDCNKNQPKNIKSFHIIYHHKLRFFVLSDFPINGNLTFSFMSINKQQNKHNKPYPPCNPTAYSLILDIYDYSNNKRN